MTEKKRTRKRVAGPEEIRRAETLFCENKWSCEAIADTLGRDIKTIFAWRDKYKWVETKDILEMGPTELKKILLSEAIRVAKGEVKTDEEGNPVKGIDADAISKIMKAYDYMSKKLSVEVIHDVLVMFDNWMVGMDAKVAIEFTKYHKLFIQYVIDEES